MELHTQNLKLGGLLLPQGANEAALEASKETDFVSRLFQALDEEGNGLLKVSLLKDRLSKVGFSDDHPTFRDVFNGLKQQTSVSADQLRASLGSSALLFEKAFTGGLVVPCFDQLKQTVVSIFEDMKDNKKGVVADYIPQLARVNPSKFGVSICTVDGQMFSLGDSQEYFSIQSICKPINYLLALEECGEDVVHRHVGREPSGHSFNEITLDSQRRPHNPMINAGAIMCSSMIQKNNSPAERFDYVLNAWKRLSGGMKPSFDNAVYLSEKSTADRNFALAYFMRENGGFPQNTDLLSVLDFYFQCCSIGMTVESMSVVAGTLAKSGTCPLSGDHIFNPSDVKHCLSLMYSCGMYDFSGEFAFTIGLPAKSGVGGGLMIVVPQVMGICIWSPPLDELGNSVRGIEFCKRLVKAYSVHKYDGLGGMNDKLSPTQHAYRSQVEGAMALCLAASRGDLAAIQELNMNQIDLNECDYDQRTALHLSCAEGHEKVVRYLLNQGVQLQPQDRWGRTPLQEAELYGHDTIAKLLNHALDKASSRTH